MPVLRLSRLAEADLERIADYIARDNPVAAVACWPPRPGSAATAATFAPHTRSFPVGHYVVFFEAVPGGIEVLRVLHGARDIRSL